MIWELNNQILPVDMYCYLYAKYGAPNGLQNFLRSNHSDNLIHWEWALASADGLILIQGHNFRSEVHLMGDFRNKGLELNHLITQFKADFSVYGKKMKEVRTHLEKWTQFINPYKRISSAVEQHIKKLEELNLSPQMDKLPQPITEDEYMLYKQHWAEVANKYNYAVGLAFGIRSMLPVLAESFVNLLLSILGKPEIKNNDRLFQDTVRRPIDIRVQSLHLNCNHFYRPVDYGSAQCKAFHSLMNERNDILHGNLDLNRLSFGEVFFNGNVPVFNAYESFWDKSIGVSIQSIRIERIKDDYQAVKMFILYLLDCLDPSIREVVEYTASMEQLGFNKTTNRIGILFPKHLVDFRTFGRNT
jgi:hypothetical protein